MLTGCIKVANDRCVLVVVSRKDVEIGIEGATAGVEVVHAEIRGSKHPVILRSVKAKVRNGARGVACHSCSTRECPNFDGARRARHGQGVFTTLESKPVDDDPVSPTSGHEQRWNQHGYAWCRC